MREPSLPDRGERHVTLDRTPSPCPTRRAPDGPAAIPDPREQRVSVGQWRLPVVRRRGPPGPTWRAAGPAAPECGERDPGRPPPARRPQDDRGRGAGQRRARIRGMGITRRRGVWDAAAMRRRQPTPSNRGARAFISSLRRPCPVRRDASGPMVATPCGGVPGGAAGLNRGTATAGAGRGTTDPACLRAAKAL